MLIQPCCPNSKIVMKNKSKIICKKSTLNNLWYGKFWLNPIGLFKNISICKYAWKII